MPKSERGTGARRPRFFTEPTPGGNGGGQGQGNGGGRPDRPGRPGQGGHQGGGSSGGSPTIVTFLYTGANQTFNLPANANSYIDIDLAGSRGAGVDFGSPYDRGARVQCRLAMTPNTSATVVCGGVGIYSSNDSTNAGGFNGGGVGLASNSKPAAGGGGATDIRIGGTALTDRKVVGGGGGGSANNQIVSTTIIPGCAGGYPTGGSGLGYDGGPGTQSAGGGGGDGPGAGAAPGTAGVLGVGGDGSTYAGNTGGGGGGGYYGGGGGGVRSDSGNGGGGGGGGSSWTHATDATLVTHTNASNGGPGYCYITYYSPTPVTYYTDADTFTRADSASSLGVTSSKGTSWAAVHATWGISSNRAYRASGGGGYDGIYCKSAVVQTNKADGEVSVDVTAGTNNTGCGVTLRNQDSTNGWTCMMYRSGAGATSIYLQKWTAGVNVDVLSNISASGSTGTLLVRFSGSTIFVYWNGALIGYTIDSAFSTATKHGLCDYVNGASADANFLDNWAFTAYS